MDWLYQEFIKQPIPILVAVVGVLSAALTALVALIGVRSNVRALAAKDAQIQTLKTQIESSGAFDAKNFLLQHQSQIELYDRENSRLKAEVRGLVGRIRDLNRSVSEEQRAISSLMGVARILGATDTELLLRRIASLVMKRGTLKDFGDAESEVFKVFLDIMDLIVPDEETAREIARSAPEYIFDEAILPLLAVARQNHLSDQAYRLVELFVGAMNGTPLEWEADIYKQALLRAKQGFDFSSGSLPLDLSERFIMGERPKQNC